MSSKNFRRVLRNSILCAMGAATAAQADTWTQPPAAPTGDANIKTIYTSSATTKVGIGFTAPASGTASTLKSSLDIKGNAAIGIGFAGITAAPANGLIVEGNTGIGFNAPQDKLHVAGVIAFHGVGLDGSTYQRAALYADATNQFLVEAPKKSDGSKLNMIFNWRGGGTPALFIKGANSFVGLGTNDPKELLDVRGNATILGSLQATSVGMVGAGLDGSTYQRAAIYANNAEGMVFEAPKKSDGVTLGDIKISWRGQTVPPPFFVSGATQRVGIGTLSPSEKLDVAGNAKINGKMIIGGSSATNYIKFATNEYNSSNGAQIYQDNSGHIGIDINSTKNAMFITRDGSVQIGQQLLFLPEKLVVAGDAKVTGTLASANLAIIGAGLSGDTYQRAVLYANNAEGMVFEAPKKSDGVTLGDIKISWRGQTVPPPFFVNGATQKVGIGTLTPSEKLEVAGNVKVNGTLAANDIKCKVWQIAPDYVFEKEYDLRKLDDVERFIAAKKHLPEVPSAKQIAKDGLNLAEMNLLLLKKVEELTLYAIEQNKRIAKLESARAR